MITHWLARLREHWVFFSGLALGSWLLLAWLLRAPASPEESETVPKAAAKQDAMLDLPLVAEEHLLPPFPKIPQPAPEEQLPPEKQPWAIHQRSVPPPPGLRDQIPAPPGGWDADTPSKVVRENIVVVKPEVLAEMRSRGELDQLLHNSYERAKERALAGGEESSGLSLEELQKLRNEGALIIE